METNVIAQLKTKQNGGKFEMRLFIEGSATVYNYVQLSVSVGSLPVTYLVHKLPTYRRFSGKI